MIAFLSNEGQAIDLRVIDQILNITHCFDFFISLLRPLRSVLVVYLCVEHAF